ncbi:hypothetical protein [Streptomyces pinistramenti]|uniref:hypothetical protein n=1 Tax=Streptomyces pinistramenti TaxID=2884812 RepID=UPI001D084A88|nr:hypothetical protein [Streptomyces pinistramenti]MCB5906493.1 hypothetical protein [Streptomyces pinistramenti]
MIKVIKRRGHWNAQLTDKGRQYLANGDTSPGERSGEASEVPGGTLTPPRPHPVPKARTNYTADQLLKELSANNNFLVKHVESGPHTVNWASRVNAARKSGKIPHTQDLRGKQTRRGYEIKLIDIPAWRHIEPAPVPVPARLTRPHSVVIAHRTSKQAQPMGLTKPVQGRALRIIQALITTTASQGHTAALGPTQGAPPSHRRRSAPPHFTITARDATVGFLVLQEQNRSAHIPTDKELADAKKHTWMRIPRFDHTPANRLCFILRGGSPHRGNEGTDLPDRPLEDQLAEIVQEVDLRGEAAERDRHADEQHQEAAGQNWESAALKARAAHTHTYRVKHLEEQVDAWHQAKRLTEYVTAVRDHATSLLPGQERTEIEAWLAFADAHLQQLTESASAPKLPIPPQPSGADLEPFLGRRSPCGPRSPQAPNQAITGKASPRDSKEGAPEDRT